MRLAPRLVAALSGLALALGGAVALAPAASATPQGCYYYVLENKPDADTAIVEDACLLGEPGGQVAFTACYTALRADSVPAAIAAEACRRAPQE
ncbi:hypothetical protein ACWCPE_23360 [Streptomyces nondiastaticus]